MRPQAHRPFLLVGILKWIWYTALMNKILTRTICIKLDTSAHDAVLSATMKAFNAAALWIARVCRDGGHCEKANRRTQSEFLCVSCGYAANADFVGARNIQTVAVNLPMVAAPLGLTCRKGQ